MFVITKNTRDSLTYLTLIDKVNELKYLNTEISIDTTNVSLFYIQLLALLINDVDVEVYDQKTSTENKVVPNKIKINTVDELINKVIVSKSRLSLFTSGTTGKPKKITHNVSRFVQMCRIEQEFRSNIWGMLYNPTHMAGLQVFFQAFLNKNSIVYLFETSRDEFLKTVEKEVITHISATPTFYRLLGPFNFVLPTIERCTLGGEKSDKKLLENLKNIFVNAKINNIYASTEAGAVFISKGDTFQVIEELKDKVKFIDNEIVLHNTLLGSFEKEEWFYTGDLVDFIDEKQFVIVSRKSDFVNVGGNRVNLLEVEEIIRGLNEVVDLSIGTQDNSVLGKVLVANIILNIELTKKEFKQLIKPLLTNFMMPTKIIFVDRLEVTRSGKLTRL